MISIPYTENAAGCWIADNAPEPSGYVRLNREGKRWMAHRRAWHETHGPIPPGLLVLHRCDVRRCINPGHLFLGDQQANMDDMGAKGRRRTGEQMTGSKLTEAKVRVIRSTRMSDKDIAEIMGVAKGTVQRIRQGKKWRHVA